MTIVEKIQSTYAKLDRTTVSSNLLDELYHQDVVFIDPLHKIETLDNLKTYFAGMYANVLSIHFDFKDTMSDDTVAFLSWEMSFTHPKLNGGKTIVVPGTTLLHHQDQKVIFHQDFFDSTHMIFDHIPVLKSILSAIKNRMN